MVPLYHQKYNYCLQVAQLPILIMSKIFKVLNNLCDISINKCRDLTTFPYSSFNV